MGYDARQGHCEMGCWIRATWQSIKYRRNIHAQEEASALRPLRNGSFVCYGERYVSASTQLVTYEQGKPRAAAYMCIDGCLHWLRPGEANNLDVRDVHPLKDEKGRSNYRFVVRGKAGERDAIVRSVALKRLDKFLTKRRAEDPAGLLFAMSNGSKITALIDQLNAALREAGVERSAFGEKYPIYGLRHFYAVNALRNCVGGFESARNMGTSVEIIQEYYGKQATAAVFATRLGD